MVDNQHHISTVPAVTAVRAPSGLNFSRCTEAQPWPPLPAAMCSSTRSTKVVMTDASRQLKRMNEKR